MQYNLRVYIEMISYSIYLWHYRSPASSDTTFALSLSALLADPSRQSPRRHFPMNSSKSR